eukprot:scaffold137954_cov31-Tisochrysis_lutea.AAC.7
MARVASAAPKAAGTGGKTGKMRTRNVGCVPSSAAFAPSGIGRRPTLCFSDEYTHSMRCSSAFHQSAASPAGASSFRYFDRLVAIGSPSTSARGVTSRVPQSALPPAPRALNTRRPVLIQWACNSALVLRSSIASITNAGSPSRSLSAILAQNRDTRASISASGSTARRAARSATAFGVPTSCLVAVACRLREESVTWSKSTRRRRRTPLRNSRCAAWLPTPPRPMTTTSGCWWMLLFLPTARESFGESTMGLRRQA